MQQYNILLVDDSQSILNALKRIFKLENYKVYTALSARDALFMLENYKIDVLITDEGMPEASGTDLLMTINSKTDDLIKIMLTGATDIEIIKNAINNGNIYKFFSKPWDDEELLTTVKQALHKRDLENENKNLKEIIIGQKKAIQVLEKHHPGIANTKIDSDGCIIIEE